VSRRAASLRVFARTLGRAALLAALALDAWGSLLLLLTFGNAITRGPRAALGLLLPTPGSRPWGWVGAVAAGLALLSWTAAAVLLLVSRWRLRGDASATSEPPGPVADGVSSPPPDVPRNPNAPAD